MMAVHEKLVNVQEQNSRLGKVKRAQQFYDAIELMPGTLRFAQP